MTQVQPTLVENIEKRLLDHIVEGLKNNSLTTEQSEELARQFLALLPPKDKEDLLAKLDDLGKIYPAAKQTFADFYIEQEEKRRQSVLDAMRGHIKNGQIEKAIAVAKGGSV